jgi:hypothetical protein
VDRGAELKGILDKSFRYVKASETTVDYLRRRFAQERKRLEALKAATQAKVTTLKVK